MEKSNEVKFHAPRNGGDGDWFMVVNEQGTMHCSCGRTLEKVDEDTYRCSYGYPQYRPSKGEVAIDKWGNIMIKIKEHKNVK